MKTKILKLSTIFLLFALIGASCEKKDDLYSTIPEEVGEVLSVFDLKYGDSKIITNEGSKIELSIKSIEDNVTVNCSLVDFKNNQEAPLAIRLFAYLKINNQDAIIKVASKPCGAIVYEDNGNDLQDVRNLISNLESAPANEVDDSYFNDAFINLFGEGTVIENTPFQIFMGKASPTRFNLPDAKIEDYQFTFIVTIKN